MSGTLTVPFAASETSATLPDAEPAAWGVKFTEKPAV
jgi:hypothetical protein